MKIPNCIKIAWWVIIVLLLTGFLLCRFSELMAGRAVPLDVVVFTIWIALLLAPLFSEVSLLGITLKHQIDELKSDIASLIIDVKNDVQNEIRQAVDIRATFSPSFIFPFPPKDETLEQMGPHFKSVVSDEVADRGIEQPKPVEIVVSKDVEYLFGVRHNLEKEIRRIANERQLNGENRRPLPSMQLTRALRQAELLSPRLEQVIREVYSVCSVAIHGESVTEAQIDFVREVGPELIAVLRTIS